MDDPFDFRRRPFGSSLPDVDDFGDEVDEQVDKLGERLFKQVGFVQRWIVAIIICSTVISLGLLGFIIWVIILLLKHFGVL